MEAIILAGGLGTRLRSEVQDVPKSMALIHEKPFLEYQLDHLMASGIKRFIFSVGYKSDHIKDHFNTSYKGCSIQYAVEETQLGTGGAIKNAMQFVKGEHVVVLNGDSIFYTDLQKQIQLHLSSNADVSLALKRMEHFERYGSIEMDDQSRINRFNEKKAVKKGLINAGVYVFKVSTFLSFSWPDKFSIEKDYFESKVDKLKFTGVPSNGYFLDIGIPADYQKAQYEIGVFSQIDQSWTLFLDRDGVINRKLDNDYVKSLGEFELLSGASEAIAHLSHTFGRLVIVTNQQGIGKGLMTHDDLAAVHDVLLEKVKALGGNIDAFYYAPQLAAENSEMRKPNIGMALQAKRDFPEINFSKSLLVGDSASDIAFANNAGMKAVFISSNPSNDVHEYTLPSLASLCEVFRSQS